MIYWFSGTGNSLQVARLISEGVHLEMKSMCEGQPGEQELVRDRQLGFVFPVYGWRMPNVVSRFLENLPVCPPGYDGYVFAVLTCGDDIGRADRLVRKALVGKGWPVWAIFSVQMRNTYVCLPGFDVDSKEVVERKRAWLDGDMFEELVSAIRSFMPSLADDVHPGAFPNLKTYVLGPLFHRWLTHPKHFKVSDSCSGCGRCAQVCPLHNITQDADSRPVWDTHCAHCLACYHVCPHHAIGYGPFTRGKGQVKLIR